ncbi:MAG TPA: DMT family transporter [Actinomycetota bacterium]|nr:DMT family transporter [Actinomycetota bacterium]
MRATGVITTARGTRTEAFGATEWGLLAAIAAMWGSSYLLIAVGLEAFPPTLIALLRLAFGAVAVGAFRRARRPIDREDLPRVALLGVIWMAVPLLLFPIGQDLGIASSVAGMINGAMPLFAALFAWILLARAPAARQGVGLALGFAGVVLILLPSLQGAAATAVGAALLILAVTLYGLSANITVPLQQKYGALPVVFRAQLVALVLLAPLGLAFGLPRASFALDALAAMVALGVFGSGLAFIAMATLVGRAGATRGAVAIYFVPVVALALGVTILGERPAPISLAGVALVLLGAYLTSRREAR